MLDCLILIQIYIVIGQKIWRFKLKSTTIVFHEYVRGLTCNNGSSLTGPGTLPKCK